MIAIVMRDGDECTGPRCHSVMSCCRSFLFFSFLFFHSSSIFPPSVFRYEKLGNRRMGRMRQSMGGIAPCVRFHLADGRLFYSAAMSLACAGWRAECSSQCVLSWNSIRGEMAQKEKRRKRQINDLYFYLAAWLARYTHFLTVLITRAQ